MKRSLVSRRLRPIEEYANADIEKSDKNRRIERALSPKFSAHALENKADAINQSNRRRTGAQSLPVSKAKAPIVSTTSVEVFFTSMLRLLSEVFGSIVRFGWHGRSPRLHGLLCRAERAVESLLFLKAVVLHPTLACKRRAPRFAPRGFRRVTAKGRLFFRSAHIRAKKANASSRVMALIDALMHPAPAVRHFLKKLRRGLRSGRLVPTAPPNETLMRAAIICAIQLVDTS